MRKGETLASIASKHGVTVVALTQVNGLRRKQTLRSGQRLRLPRAGGAGAASIIVAAAPKPATTPPLRAGRGLSQRRSPPATPL